MQWTDDFRIETPEQIEVSLELAGLGSRFVARIVDCLSSGASYWSLAFWAPWCWVFSAEQGAKWSLIFLLGYLALLFYAFFLGYDIYFEVRSNGQTPGKKHAGIRSLPFTAILKSWPDVAAREQGAARATGLQ